jgi:hypothetical protein
MRKGPLAPQEEPDVTKSILIALAAAATLIGASPPEMDAVVAADKPAAGAPEKKHAVQPAAKPAAAPRVAEGGGAYPPCSATVRDRCNQNTRNARYVPTHQVRHRQLAMRAGERG